jgi:hypothetical protein
MTNPVPVTVKLIQEVVQEAIETHSSRRFTGTLSEEQIEAYEELFRQYMQIYRSHWRDDPLFDCTNTTRALPHLPCPAIDREMLMRIASYPVKEKFILKRIEQQLPGFEPHEHLRRVVAARQPGLAGGGADSRSIGLEVSGSHGGQWRLTVRGGRLVEVERGLGPDDGLRYYLNSHTFSSLVEGRCSVEQSIEAGRVLVEGPLDGHDRHPDFVSVLESIVTPA